MMAERESRFYDEALDNPRHASWLPLEQTPYRQLFDRTATLIPDGLDVVELGCGTGRLASLIGPRSRSYIGLDFSPRRIEEARRYAPGLDFRIADLRSDPIPPADLYVANELLEHLADDLGLLLRLPAGAQVVLSVPSFDSAAHVRYFPLVGQAAERYGAALTLDASQVVPYGEHFFHLLRGRR
jgi:trans-aconitate methyltransferase